MTPTSTVVLALAVAVSRLDDLPTPAEVEERALQSFHIVVAIHSDLALTKPDKHTRIAQRLEIWRAWPKHRQVQTPLDGEPLDSTGISRKVICRGCGPASEVFTHHPPKISANLYPTGHPDAKRWDNDLTDPTVIGYIIPGLSLRAQLDVTVGKPGLKYLSAERTTFRGDDAILVKALHPASANLQHSCWVVPAKGYNVVRVEERVLNDPTQPADFVESELALDAPSGVWFPRRAVRRIYSGTRLEHDETVDVEVAEFNRVPDSVFTLAELGLPVNEPVYHQGKSRSYYWTGSKLADRPTTPPAEVVTLAAADAPTPVGPPVGGRDRWLAPAACVAFAVAATALLRRAVFRTG